MLDAFTARLEACDPSHNHFRAYRMEAGIDLLGDWLVDVTYGRIGAPGRTIRHVAADEQEAQKIVRHCLQRRATAPRRIGISYQLLRDLDDPAGWVSSETAISYVLHRSLWINPLTPAWRQPSNKRGLKPAPLESVHPR